jgi:MFS family permease
VFVQGLGFGFAMMPNAVTGLNALPMRYVASATAIRQLGQRVSASFGVAVLATVLATRLADVAPKDTAGAQSAYQTVFLCAAALAVVATVLAVFLPGRQRNRELLSERSTEMAQSRLDAPVDVA